MSYASDGIGAGLMQLSNIFGTMLMKRMDANFQDEHEEKRLAAANRAEIEKLRLLREFQGQTLGGSRPYMEGDQVMVQDVSQLGTPLAAPRPARPDEAFPFQQAQQQAAMDKRKADIDILSKESTIQKNEETTKTEASRRNYYDARAKKALAEPTTKPKDYEKQVYDMEDRLNKLRGELVTEPALLKELETRIAQASPQGADVTNDELAATYRRIYNDMLGKWQKTKTYVDALELKRAMGGR